MEPSRRAALRLAWLSGAAMGGTAALTGCSGPSSPRRSSPPGSRSASATTSGTASVTASGSGPAYEQVTVGAIVLRSTPGADLTTLRSQAQTAWAWATSAWPGIPRPARVIVWAPTTTAEFAAWGGDAAESGAVAAAARSDGSVILDPRLSSEVTPTGVTVVLAHEFSHVLLHQAGDSTTPKWLIEGSAQWAAFRRTGRTLPQLVPLVVTDVRARRYPTGPPADAQFADDATLEHTYELAYAWCAFLIERIGMQRWRQLVESAPESAERIDTLLRSWTGHPAAGLAASYREFLVGALT